MWDALSLLRSQDCVRPQFTFLLHAGIEELTREWLLPTWQLPCECDNLDPRCERCARRQIGGLDLCESTPRFGLCWYLGRASADKGVSLPPLD